MAILKFSGSCILFLIYINNVFCGVPVLIWESSAISEKEDVVPALSQLTVDEFTNHLLKKVHSQKSLIVLFLEETLSIEDFSWLDSHGLFPQIKNISSMSAKREFLTSVVDPVESLKQLTTSHDYVWKNYNGEKLPSEGSVVLVVELQDPQNNDALATRPELLRQHDGDIAEIYSQLLSKHSRIVAIYTGKQSSWVELESNRVKREIDSDNSTGPCIRDTLFNEFCTSTAPILSDGVQNFTLSEKPEVMQDIRPTFNRMILKYTAAAGKITKIILRLRFQEEKGRWSLRDIEYEGDNNKAVTLEPSQEISAPVGTSFKAENAVTFSKGPVSLKFADLQVEAFKTKMGFSEGSAGDETPIFFTGPIWSGLIVTFVLGLILTWGITMLLDIRTMDRFDDPKGKTISVSAQE